MVSHLLDGRTGCEQHAGFQHIVTAATGYLMQLRRTTLQRLTIWAPAAFIAFLTLVVLYFHPDILSPWIIGLIVAGVAGIGTYIFSRFVFSHIQRQEKEIIWRGEAMASINALGTEIISLLELDEILRSVAEKARQLLGTEVSTLYLLDEEGGLVPKALCGPQEAFQVGGNGRDAYSSWKTGQGLGLSLSFGKQGLKCPGIKEGYMRAHLSAPLQRGEKVVGVLWVADRSPRRFLPLESELLSLLAIQAAIAIENAGLREQLSNVAIIGERHRIAREIHDGLAQELAFFSLKLGELEGNASACPLPCPNLEGIRLIKKVAGRAYDEARHSIFSLKTVVSLDLGLIPTLTQYCREFGEQAGIAVDLKFPDGEATKHSVATEVQLIRIIQEALANVRKHAQTKRAWVVFETVGRETKVTIRDDGLGFAPADATDGQTSFGLRTMRERAESVGGTLRVESQRGKGTDVIVRLPGKAQEVTSWTS